MTSGDGCDDDGGVCDLTCFNGLLNSFSFSSYVSNSEFLKDEPLILIVCLLNV